MIRLLRCCFSCSGAVTPTPLPEGQGRLPLPRATEGIETLVTPPLVGRVTETPVVEAPSFIKSPVGKGSFAMVDRTGKDQVTKTATPRRVRTGIRTVFNDTLSPAEVTIASELRRLPQGNPLLAHLPRVDEVTDKTIAMEFVPQDSPPQHLPLITQARIEGMALCQALVDLERVMGKPIVHQDIKPDNIRYRANGTPVLLDFGSAVSPTDTSFTFEEKSTPFTASPESHHTTTPDPTMDSWSIGVVMFMRLTKGRHPISALNGLDKMTFMMNIADYGEVDSPLRATYQGSLAVQIRALRESLPPDDLDAHHTLTVMEQLLDINPATRLTPAQALSWFTAGGPPSSVSLA